MTYNKVQVKRSNFTDCSNNCGNNIGRKTLQKYLMVFITRGVEFSHEDRPENSTQESFSHSKLTENKQNLSIEFILVDLLLLLLLLSLLLLY
jgi:hypothetical protein